jgi:hypothetical protein
LREKKAVSDPEKNPDNKRNNTSTRRSKIILPIILQTFSNGMDAE